jgi:hypothetical protein
MTFPQVEEIEAATVSLDFATEAFSGAPAPQGRS